jgi:hypothetical protein
MMDIQLSSVFCTGILQLRRMHYHVECTLLPGHEFCE